MGRVAVAVMVSLWVIPISILVNRIVPEPYMDEIFHIPQAQQYCKGNFRSWDPMITTPPGLYYLSLAHVTSLFPGLSYLNGASSIFEVCSPVILRSVNGVLAVICSILLYEIITLLRPALDDRKATFYAVVLSMYPLHWFFTFLYYTDVASLTAVLAMYLACLRKNYWFSGLLGALAVVIRQTNIIWMLFVASSEVINITLGQQRDKVDIDDASVSIRKNGQQAPENNAILSSNLRKRKISSKVDTSAQSTHTTSASSRISTSGLVDDIIAVCLTSLRMKKKLFVGFAPFIIVLVAFVAFVRWNGSVVLGAKEAHAVSLHFAQIMYFGIFSALVMAPLYFSFGETVNFFQSIWKNRPHSFFQVILALIAGFISVHFFSIAHPYLLADNRHYTFYLWRKIIKAYWPMKYVLVPLYVYSWLSICTRLGKNQRKIWVMGYFLATAAVLIPAPLIEFRYYTIPFFFLILHSHNNDIQSWVLMGSLYVALNVFTMAMFLCRPFYWDHDLGTQRFIW
ncbi:dol-P-Glc:Glc(2)Man(9)GlcNAc(2)-PP-Dol alpha-1,2-glucosyltransferase [Humulus lupulus]|uniref:dol-P-Glc:Glc(2)Man(9)GlcNAc(2)-PP-Dol alpha-1,2-glucosyltransferase n=1 Tax=Humulus lupulus TaxID=3486 RepID=UPI002B4117D8|nr:dol-P-Glc:Glc(2)Man(9)GlcNAc(2)-PP-Dol alpha-1,2-glucosyltransferase [Humulus lupulus]XP_062095642.1 dol-P-Glc:Glc(2)Man(9)GlcNAc(2)-PP-Dol alpha-1,2-glucosyltransferase [Humulus lupulus]